VSQLLLLLQHDCSYTVQESDALTNLCSPASSVGGFERNYSKRFYVAQLYTHLIVIHQCYGTSCCYDVRLSENGIKINIMQNRKNK
jgi:hypothetical protein